MPFLPILCSRNEKIKDVKLHLLYVDSIDTLFIESLRATQLQLSFGFPYWVASGVDDRGNSAATFFELRSFETLARELLRAAAAFRHVQSDQIGTLCASAR